MTKTNIDINEMAKGYLAMGTINLQISKESYVAETEGEMISEMVAEEGYKNSKEA